MFGTAGYTMQISSINLDAIPHFEWLSNITFLCYQESQRQACNMQTPRCRKVIKQLQFYLIWISNKKGIMQQL